MQLVTRFSGHPKFLVAQALWNMHCLLVGVKRLFSWSHVALSCISHISPPIWDDGPEWEWFSAGLTQPPSGHGSFPRRPLFGNTFARGPGQLGLGQLVHVNWPFLFPPWVRLGSTGSDPPDSSAAEPASRFAATLAATSDWWFADEGHRWQCWHRDMDDVSFGSLNRHRTIPRWFSSGFFQCRWNIPLMKMKRTIS